ncbi:hypothetical protein KIN20_022349 [Parelaphostrongylus tenuis]|uniref:Nuclear envelope integral membrane protein 1 n=1 Tax=Parelaphostrongylus tenuis TaxID=148309 RepID=A0AAD5QVA6_PARTN|nr:hypothetical protein KIN20_022349 [Parelaphostrongylus tenuis]
MWKCVGPAVLFPGVPRSFGRSPLVFVVATVDRAIFGSRFMICWERLSALFTFILVVLLFRVSSCTAICQARELGTSRWIVPGKVKDELDLYIHRGLDYSLVNAFADTFLELNLTDEDTYDLYKGDNCSVVQEDFHFDNRLFGLFKSADFWRSRHLNVFNDTVIGISTRLPYTVGAKVLKVNNIRLGVFVAGVLLFIFANDLVRNSLFYYGSGCSLGLLTSLLIIVFILYRVAPKSLIRLPILIGGWSLSFYVLHFAWKNLATIVFRYQKLLVAYFVTVLAISFAVCYKRGPPKDRRSRDIAQWTLQMISMIIIYSSSQVAGAGTFLGYNCNTSPSQSTRSWYWNPLYGATSVLTSIWWKIFPPKHRLLTEEEYTKEGVEVTRRELERLREFCRSPEADVWKLTSKVRDPKRLARFVDGREGHVLEDEEDLYDEDSGSSNQWKRQVVFRRTPKSDGETVSFSKKSSRRSTGLLPSERSQLYELPEHSRSAYYYQETSQRRSPRHLLASLSSASKSKHFSSSKTGNDSSVRKYKEYQELTKVAGKQRSRPISNEFFSSDSESDAGAM